MKRKIISILIFIIIMGSCTTTINVKYSLNRAQGELNEVSYFAGAKDNFNYEKVLLFIRGTTFESAAQDFGMGAEATYYGYIVIHPEKSYLDDLDKCIRLDNRIQRMHDLRTIIEDLKKKGTKEIIVIADSEGTMLAPALCVEYSDLIKGLVSMSGSLFSFREDLLYSTEYEKGQMNIFSLNEMVENLNKIDANPECLDCIFWGHTYKWWSSYIDYEPLSDILNCNIPILYMNGRFDELDIEKQYTIIEDLKSTGKDIEQIIYEDIGHKLGVEEKRNLEDIMKWAVNKGLI